jgi:hypothetical protein
LKEINDSRNRGRTKQVEVRQLCTMSLNLSERHHEHMKMESSMGYSGKPPPIVSTRCSNPLRPVGKHDLGRKFGNWRHRQSHWRHDRQHLFGVRQAAPPLAPARAQYIAIVGQRRWGCIAQCSCLVSGFGSTMCVGDWECARAAGCLPSSLFAVHDQLSSTRARPFLAIQSPTPVTRPAPFRAVEDMWVRIRLPSIS